MGRMLRKRTADENHIGKERAHNELDAIAGGGRSASPGSGRRIFQDSRDYAFPGGGGERWWCARRA
jgi:hypothetical protein